METAAEEAATEPGSTLRPEWRKEIYRHRWERQSRKKLGVDRSGSRKKRILKSIEWCLCSLGQDELLFVESKESEGDKCYYR